MDKINLKKEDKEEENTEWEWASTIAEGIPPSARGGHTATLIGKSIAIFGGHYYSDKNTGFVYLNDTHFLDVALSKWIKPYCTGKIPPLRYGHTAIYAGGIIIIFGGKGPKNTVYNDLYTFDPDPDKYVWLLANETGEAPLPRFNHTANLWSIYIIIIIILN
jgi:N-acetylneuraminic acid mutarotase